MSSPSFPAKLQGEGVSARETPAACGFRMPAEWMPHEATWLSWPHNVETWSAQLSEVEEIYCQMVEVLARGEKIHLLVRDGAEEDRVGDRLSKRRVPMDRIRFFRIPTVDAWIRDYGPIFLVRRREDGAGELATVRWFFNAWGGKYESMAADQSVPELIARLLGIPSFTPGIILEGGSIDVNGEGALLTTEQCLLNPNRNPRLAREAIEQCLRDFLGITHAIWLGKGIVGDDTDGHVDDVARFVSSDAVLCAVETDTADANHGFLQENLKRLRRSFDQEGKPLKVIELPMPGKVECPEGRLPASYANFYIGNKAVLLPTYRHPHDREAARILEKCFPSREIVGIPCVALLYGLGAIHCVTQQQPRAGR